MSEGEEEKLKLGKGAAFVKSRLKRLPQGEDAWEADFQVLPRPIDQRVTHYLGMVVSGEEGSLLADLPIHGRPSVNDLATILAHAMRRPLDGIARRPRLVRLRGHHQWRGLFPHLEEVGVEVLVGQSLSGIEAVYGEHLRRLREASRVGMVRPSTEQAKVETMFPSIARWVQTHGWIEVGQSELSGFVARALHEGGTQVDDERPIRWPKRWPPWRWAWHFGSGSKAWTSTERTMGLELLGDRPSPRTPKPSDVSSSETGRDEAIPARAPSPNAVCESEEVCHAPRVLRGRLLLSR